MSVPDFLLWHCADCGMAADGTKKPCACEVNVAVRKGPNGLTETTMWDNPPDPRDAEIERLKLTATKELLKALDVTTAIRAELDRANEREVALREALTKLDRMITDWARDQGFPVENSGCWQVVRAALSQPSPAAEAIRKVLEASRQYMNNLNNVSALMRLGDACDAYERRHGDKG